MALELSRKKPQFVPMTFAGGAVWQLRPATSIDVETARRGAARQLAGIVSGSAAVEALSATLEWIALLLTDHQVRSRVQRILYSGIHDVVENVPTGERPHALLGPSRLETYAGTKGADAR